MESRPTIFIITGSIAAGKSTVAYNFINKFDLCNVPYVSTDIYYNLFFSDFTNFDVGYNLARLYTDRILDEYLKNRTTFVWETVFSKSKKWDFLERCTQSDYNIISVFVVASLETTVKRSKNRQKIGGNNVRGPFLRDRYNKSIAAISLLRQRSNMFILLNNDTNIELLLFYENGKQLYQKEVMPTWLNNY